MLAPAAPTAPTAVIAQRLAPADRAVLEAALRGVDRTPEPPQSSYLGELVRSATEALVRGVIRGAEMLHVPRQVLIAAAFVAAAVALALIVRTLLPRLLRLVRRRAPEGAGMLAGMSVGPAQRPGTRELDAAGWRAELDRRLAAGSTAEALEAAWWWLARSLAGRRAEPDWTSRDLVTRVGRPDLAALIRRLDAYIYGPRRPTLEDVRGLVSRLAETLATLEAVA
ncbi:MAG TPA: hypothetical protein VF173_17245 [Thermoanaerobaculia bacterium]|nr:hypothetical protein [Thermoanaerobaculia bacterium]